MQDTRSIAQKLVGSNVLTLVRGEPNQVLGVSDKGITVQTKKSTQVVPWSLVDSVIDELFTKRTVTGQGLRDAGIQGGYRSAFILALLARTSFATSVHKGRSVRIDLRT